MLPIDPSPHRWPRHALLPLHVPRLRLMVARPCARIRASRARSTRARQAYGGAISREFEATRRMLSGCAAKNNHRSRIGSLRLPTTSLPLHCHGINARAYLGELEFKPHLGRRSQTNPQNHRAAQSRVASAALVLEKPQPKASARSNAFRVPDLDLPAKALRVEVVGNAWPVSIGLPAVRSTAARRRVTRVARQLERRVRS